MALEGERSCGIVKVILQYPPMKQAVIKSEMMRRVLDSAADFQQLVPDAVMVGGSAVSAYTGHRQSFDHDHVLTDLAERFASIFEFLAEQEKWHTAHVRQGKVILGSFENIETGLRQLRRCRPLETERLALPEGKTLVVPTLDEILRVKAFLITNRNQTRDFLDVAALADRFGMAWGARVLSLIDQYYEKALSSSGSVAADLIRMLGAPDPKDSSTTRALSSYKGLDARYHDWGSVMNICKHLAAAIIATGGNHDIPKS